MAKVTHKYRVGDRFIIIYPLVPSDSGRVGTVSGLIFNSSPWLGITYLVLFDDDGTEDRVYEEEIQLLLSSRLMKARNENQT